MLARLHVCDHPAAVWSGVLEPWLRAHGQHWRESRTVLAPNASWIAALKARAVEDGLSTIGVVWCTPGKWRAHALAAMPGVRVRVALREDLHLLLELAAASLPENPLARAYGPDPAPFQELLDTLDGAGWNADVLPDAAARELAAAAAQLRRQCGWITASEADRLLCEAFKAGTLPPLGEHLLAVGFGPGDWALRVLLETAVGACADSELALDVVDYAQTPAAAWIGAWEEIGGSAEWMEASDVPAPFAPLAAALLNPTPLVSGLSQPIPLEITPRLWLAENLQAEADVAVAQALAFLDEAGDDPSPRVGIVVGPINSPLAREVAARLAALDLPHHDVPGHAPGRVSAQALFDAWLDWQENGRLAGLVGWARVAQRHGLLSARHAAAMEKSFQEAAGATLSDDPAVLGAWLDGASTAAAEARAFLTDWPRLPPKATWKNYLETTQRTAEKLGWPDPPAAMAERAALLGEALVELMPRDTILRWVRAVTRVPGRTRDARGREPFAPLQIVDAASAAAQSWTHLVLGGLQHGEWPAPDLDSPLFNETQIAARNREVLRQGSQGEGHWTVAPDRGLLSSQADRRKLSWATFARLAGLPTRGLALTSRRADPADGRPARLSEYFWAAATQMLGRLPAESDWASLVQATHEWREKCLRLFSDKSESMKKSEHYPPGPAETARAFAARCEPETPFSEFSFCLTKPPASPLRLSCKAWEDAVARPGASWYQHVLGVEPRWDPATDDFTRRSLGTWAHEWTQPGPEIPSGTVAPVSITMPGLELWLQSSVLGAEEVRRATTAAFTHAGRMLPEAWLDAWAAARRAAHQWIALLAGNNEWPQGLGEIRLPKNLLVSLPVAKVAIALPGRMDLALFNRPVSFTSGQLNGVAAWLLDFKTGGDKTLDLKRLSKGTGLQLALYALALRALGAGAVTLTLLSRDAEAEPQLSLAELEDPMLFGLWKLLADFAVAGRWGDWHDLTDEYDRPGEHPSATLPVSGEILRGKWELTHPDFI